MSLFGFLGSALSGAGDALGSAWNGAAGGGVGRGLGGFLSDYFNRLVPPLPTGQQQQGMQDSLFGAPDFNPVNVTPSLMGAPDAAAAQKQIGMNAASGAYDPSQNGGPYSGGLIPHSQAQFLGPQYAAMTPTQAVPMLRGVLNDTTQSAANSANATRQRQQVLGNLGDASTDPKQWALQYGMATGDFGPYGKFIEPRDVAPGHSIVGPDNKPSYTAPALPEKGGIGTGPDGKLQEYYVDPLHPNGPKIWSGVPVPPDPNKAFNPDGTPNKAYQDFQVSQAAAEATARAKALNDINNPTGPDGNAIGTLGRPQIDVTAPGYSTQPIKGLGMTQSALDQNAMEYALTGRFPAGMGIGSTGLTGMRKTAIANRAAELNAGGNMQQNAAQIKALQGSLAQQTKYADTTERSVANAEHGFQQVVDAFGGKVNNAQMPIINAMKNAALYQFSPGDLSAFRAGLTEVANEYAQVFSRGGQVTEGVRNRANDIMNGNLSIADLRKTMQELKAQGDIVTKGARGQATKIQGQFNDILSGKAAAPAGGSGRVIDFSALPAK